MSSGSVGFRPNLEAIESMYLAWRSDPSSVESSWSIFFEGFEIGLQQSKGDQLTMESTDSMASLAEKLIGIFRDYGHLQATLDPLQIESVSQQILNKSLQDLVEKHLGSHFTIPSFTPYPDGTIQGLIKILQDIYCRSIGVEITHLHDGGERDWLISRLEEKAGKIEFSSSDKKNILNQLMRADLFEKFLHHKFVGQKRFSLEGGDSLIPLLEAVVESYPDLGGEHIVLGMAHRGRLNVLTNVMLKPYGDVFAEFEENFSTTSIIGDGDVKYHLGYSVDRQNTKGKNLHLSLTPNPSHLEFVNPVVEGRVRAKQDLLNDSSRRAVLPVLIHGDAAFAGQGIVPESLNLAGLEGYTTGGTFHVVINNQIGFTTRPSDSRSTSYCTDVAKIILAPIFHVNGDDPEAVVWVGKLALEYRQRFGKDVVIDIVCYRKHGHNEGDEPSFTQPIMYQNIKARSSPAVKYGERLVLEGVCSSEEVSLIGSEFESRLQRSLDEMRNNPVSYQRMSAFQGAWKNLTKQYTHKVVKTGVTEKNINLIAQALMTIPPGFNVHPKISTMIRSRGQNFADKKSIDWPTAELLAFGSLVMEGHKVRLSGQDSRRGTFSQRHSIFYDSNNGQSYSPLNFISDNQAPYDVFDSMLSEAAVLGFEFGYSLDNPNVLVLWEAQFGDFWNGAQVIVDQFIASSESKWKRESGLVMLLPHGYEGQGPEHSSSRIERLLQLCAENNLQICNASTPAQYFHLLRRQLHRDFRKPLAVMTPKSILRHKLAVSPMEEFIAGSFLEVLDDTIVDPSRVKRVVLCSGKVYYDLFEQRIKQESFDTAIIRLEQIYPFPEEQLKKILDRYGKATEFVWVQEESYNMGAWFFVEPKFRAMGYLFEYIGRDESASPAVGSKKIHESEQKQLIEAAFKGELPFFAKALPVFGNKTIDAQSSNAGTKVDAR
ncbi:MAG: 2-oxoglutarate dehydrogenase E1 component [Planctomycetes bacterium]|nr:2-oxoglutarate dehydrogenase E1 component [Planctomycetota bacterium]